MKKVILIVSLAFSINAFANTIIPGGTVSGTWTLAGSPYLVQGSIMIPNDSTLTIEPGVTVNFQGTYKMYVQGRVIAIGTATDTIIFTAADTTNGWRGIRFDNTTINNDTSKLSYCKLQYGKATGTSPDDNGGAFDFNNFSKAIISNCLISNCTANTYGGGIYGYDSSPIITNNTISNNTAYYGGGIYCIGSSPTITNNTISNNTANYYGGGIYCNGNDPTISNNTISNNTANYYGGGIYCGGSTITNNTISNNTALIDGGGIYCFQNNPTISNNAISNNSASGFGGGIYCAYSYLTITNNTISNNTASVGGGIYCCNHSNATISNNTIANNSAVNGGALYCTSTSNPILRNTILWGNTASTSGQQVYLNDEASDPNFYYCDVQGGSATFELNGGFYTGTYQNNMDSDPLFVSPSGGSGTGFNGVTADWSLQSGSPCIDAGDPSGIYPATDKAGNPRIIEVIACIIDMGAYENQSGVSCLTSIPFLTSNEQIQITIFPNPNNGIFSINSNGCNINLIEIYNVLGENIYSDAISNQKTTNEIDVSDFSKGIYFVKIYDGTEIYDRKIVVQ